MCGDTFKTRGAAARTAPGKVLRNFKWGGFDHKASGAAATVLPTSESLWQKCGSNTPKQIEVDVTTCSRNAGRS